MLNFVYILSPSYSGSTLLTYLLAQHPAVATIGELKGTAMGDIEIYECSCGCRLLDCEFWKKLCNSASEAELAFDLEDYGTHFSSTNFLFERLLSATVRNSLFEMGRRLLIESIAVYRRQLEVLLDHNEKLVELILASQGASFFVDSSKDPVRLMFFQKSRRFSIKVIRIIRDGRGVAHSFQKNDKLTMSNAAAGWLRANAEVVRVYERTPNAERLEIRYESLCNDVEKVMDQIWRFLDVGSVFQRQQVKLTGNHIIGNRMRLGGTAEIRLDERWKECLSDDAISIFDRIAGPTNRSLGYF